MSWMTYCQIVVTGLWAVAALWCCAWNLGLVWTPKK